jgi:ribosomal protein L28
MKKQAQIRTKAGTLSSITTNNDKDIACKNYSHTHTHSRRAQNSNATYKHTWSQHLLSETLASATSLLLTIVSFPCFKRTMFVTIDSLITHLEAGKY